MRLAETDVYSNEGPEHEDFLIVGRHDPHYYWTSKLNDLIVVTLHKEVAFNGNKSCNWIVVFVHWQFYVHSIFIIWNIASFLIYIVT